MAQHLLINDKYVGETKSETQAIRKLIRNVRNDLRELRETDDLESFENIYRVLPKDYIEKGETEAYMKSVDVPETMVWGGKATLEVHFRGSRLSKIYLVA